jgi:hypothetical protein
VPWLGGAVEDCFPVSVKSSSFTGETLFRDMRRWRDVWSCHLKRVAWDE